MTQPVTDLHGRAVYGRQRSSTVRITLHVPGGVPIFNIHQKVIRMVIEAALGEANRPLTPREESLHCDVCQALILHNDREVYFQTGLCEFCDARLNPYPRRPHRDDPLRAGLICVGGSPGVENGDDCHSSGGGLEWSRD
jgi:hypothetical protein